MILKEFANVLRGKAMATLAAAGSSQGDAAAVVEQVTEVTGADGTKGVILPAGGDVNEVFVLWSSASTNACKVYPPSGESINEGAANAAFSMTARKPTFFVRVSASKWLAVMGG